ncbi:DUF4955 domain-containing protein [Lutibacter citreus]|uniref:DUF4955 domain-containing protein n=1 Tax=Lutibacter citreus TaxID=2138210 RepID=UPI000DBE8D54|nr:DUF4955 domain-containing protein [Lutibacter citreus]
MSFKNVLFVTLIFSLLSCQAQNSQVWEDFKASKQTGNEPILPDFSYAGYKYSEVEIPTVNHKIFDVTKFGAIPNDINSDKDAIKKAIKAAEKNGSGIVYFPKGKYYVNTQNDDTSIIEIKGSNIVFRGEGVNKSTLFFDKDLPPTDPKKLWSCPSAIQTKASGADKKLATITSNTRRETHNIEVNDASKIKKGNWIILKVSNNDPELIKYDIQPLIADKTWSTINTKGVIVNERHQVSSVKKNTITLVEPIHYDIQAKHNWSVYSFAHSEELGFEDLSFEGNWKKEFVHHRSAQDDGGWSILQVSRCVNSWVKDCSFKNVNNALSFSQSAYSTAINITINGFIGHSSVHAAGGSTGILLANINDIAGMHHSTGVGGGSTTATVIWRSKYPSHTCFESHASQPRCTLFDNVEGGFFSGRAGGAIKSLPNHSRYLVLWNFKETDESEKDFRFIATDSWYWRIVPPIIVGFHGAGTTFNKDEVQITESIGAPVKPESLFEEQLKLRLGKLPDWITKLKNELIIN